VSRTLLLIAIGIVVHARAAAADPCADDARALRAELEHEASRVDHWVLAWRIAYTAIAVGEFAVAASGAADHDTTAGLVVGGAKSTLGALGFWTAPLHIKLPPPTGDACLDRAMLRNAAERIGADEEASFWTSHIGGLVLNTAGMLVLAGTASWRAGALSFATGYPVGLISTYTQPRTSWGRIRERAWTTSFAVSENRTTGTRYALVLSGSF
jgi:hypothetical protein